MVGVYFGMDEAVVNSKWGEDVLLKVRADRYTGDRRDDIGKVVVACAVVLAST